MQDPEEWTPEEAKVIGARVRAAREARGFSQMQAAERLGVSKAAVGHVETGARTIKLRGLVRLCESYEASADALLFGTRWWPFKAVDFDLVNELDPDDLLRLEGALVQAANSLGLQIRREVAPRGLFRACELFVYALLTAKVYAR